MAQAMKAVGVILAIVATVAVVGDRSALRLASEILVVLTLAQLWNLLAGYAGLVSVGQHALVGIGGYVLFVATTSAGLPLGPAVLAAGLVAAVGAALMFLLVSRLIGAYFSIGTWVIAEICALVALQTSLVGGASGLSLPPAVVKSLSADAGTRDLLVFLALGAVAAVVIGGALILMAGRYGMALRAIRDNPRTARSVGIPIARVKFWLFVAVAAATGIVGAILFFQKLRISPSAAFSLNEFTAIIIFVVIVGGLGSIPGPIVGTIVYFIVREVFADYGNLYLIILGSTAIFVVVAFPDGIWGGLKRSLSFLIKRGEALQELDKKSPGKSV